MPTQRCQLNNKKGFKFGPKGKCFTGPGAKAKADRQGRAIRASGGK